jgi:hypothetical protein
MFGGVFFGMECFDGVEVRSTSAYGDKRREFMIIGTVTCSFGVEIAFVLEFWYGY